MFEQDSNARIPNRSRFLTTLLAISWGVTSAYILFYSLLVTHDMRPCLAALVPLVIVWATLERKRWGRLALLGLSGVALGLFLASLGYAASILRVTLPAAQQTPLHCLQMALGIFGARNTNAATVVLILAAMTGIYLRRPNVVAEFERGKKKTLAVAQRAIAMTLVGFWGITMVGSPLPKIHAQNSATTPSLLPHPAAPKRSVTRSHASSRRSARPVASASNL